MRALLVALFVLVAHTAQARTIAYSIVIGNNTPPADSAEGLPTLHYADDDAVRYFQFLSRIGSARLLAVLDTQTQRRYAGLAAVSVPPTLANLRAVVASYATAMAADRQRGDTPVLYFAFSGHGARDRSGQAFLALLDGALTQHVLYDEIVARLPAAYVHVFVDACNAGGVVGVRGDFFDREAEARSAPVTADDMAAVTAARPLVKFPQVGVIVATSVGQEAHEWSEIESGVFTHELLSGLAGPADVNGDGNIEYSELQAFIAAANRDMKNPRAIPQVIARPPTLNQNVAVVALASTHTLDGDATALGHFYIELENGQRYLDAHLADRSVRIVLPDGAAFVRTDAADAAIPPGGRVALGDLTWTPRTVRARGSIASAFDTALFASAYGKTYYQGYVDSVGVASVQFAEPAPRRDTTVSAAPSKRRAIVAASFAGVAAVTSIVTAVLAVQAKHDYENTNLQREAADASSRFERYQFLSIGSGVLAVTGGILTWVLWPSAQTRVVPAASSSGASLTLEMPW